MPRRQSELWIIFQRQEIKCVVDEFFLGGEREALSAGIPVGIHFMVMIDLRRRTQAMNLPACGTSQLRTQQCTENSQE